MTVLGHPQRLEASLFEFLAQLDRLDRLVGWEEVDPDTHRWFLL